MGHSVRMGLVKFGNSDLTTRVIELGSAEGLLLNTIINSENNTALPTKETVKAYGRIA